MSRRLVACAAALALTAIIPTAASADLEGYKESSRSTFTLLPDEGRVHAETTITIVNKRKPTVRRGPCKNAPRRTCRITTKHYIPGWGPFHVPAEATNVSISGRGVKPYELETDITGTRYVVGFPNLAYKKTQVVNVAYDLPDAGPDAGADARTRIADAYAHFCWYGVPTDQSAVEAVLPFGWEATTSGARTTTSSTVAGTVIEEANKKLAGSTTLCTDAFRPDLLVRSHTVAPGGQLVTFDGWPDDPDWTSDMNDIIEQELPNLERTVGSAMPFASLTIGQVARTNNYGSPSDLDASAGHLFRDEDVYFAAAPVSTLARTWFDDGSIGDPWLAEGLILWAGLSSTGYACPDPAELSGTSPVSLLDWKVHDDSNTEPMLPVYQVSAACTIVEEVADLIGPEHMAAVVESLRADTPRYGDPARTYQATAQPATWTDWLDAADELGMIPAEQTDLELAERAMVRYGIATPEQLSGRFSARTLYHDTLEALGDAALPAFVDALMETWSFDAAVPAILEARRLYGVITDHPTLTDEMRSTFLHVFESAASPEALSTLDGAVSSWVPEVEPTPTDA